MQTVEVPSNHFFKYGNVISFTSEAIGESVVAKLFSKTNWLIKERFTVFQGIVTGYNPAFLPSANQIRDQHLEDTLLYPVLMGRDFEKWAIRSSERRIIYVDRNTQIEKFPNTLNFLSNYRKNLEDSRSAAERTSDWYCLHRPRVKQELDRVPKIIVQRTRNPRLATRIVATMDEYGIYGMESVLFLLPRDSGSNPYFLLGILNSKVLNHAFSTKFLNVGIKAEYLKDIPVPNASGETEACLERLVRSILAIKRTDLSADVSALEGEIDALVYKLYGLTAEEIDFLERTGSSEPNIEAEADTEVEEDAAVSDSGADEDAFN